MSILPVLQPRTCGDCSMCCKILHIPKGLDGDFPFDKPAGVWCEHCKPGNGCEVFTTTLPTTCRNYACAWLTSPDFPEELKPSKVHAVFSYKEAGGISYVAIDTDDSYPLSELLMRFIEQNRGRVRMVRYSNGMAVVSALGDTADARQKDSDDLMAAIDNRNRDAGTDVAVERLTALTKLPPLK